MEVKLQNWSCLFVTRIEDGKNKREGEKERSRKQREGRGGEREIGEREGGRTITNIGGGGAWSCFVNKDNGPAVDAPYLSTRGVKTEAVHSPPPSPPPSPRPLECPPYLTIPGKNFYLLLSPQPRWDSLGMAI